MSMLNGLEERALFSRKTFKTTSQMSISRQNQLGCAINWLNERRKMENLTFFSGKFSSKVYSNVNVAWMKVHLRALNFSLWKNFFTPSKWANKKIQFSTQFSMGEKSEWYSWIWSREREYQVVKFDVCGSPLSTPFAPSHVLTSPQTNFLSQPASESAKARKSFGEKLVKCERESLSVILCDGFQSSLSLGHNSTWQNVKESYPENFQLVDEGKSFFLKFNFVCFAPFPGKIRHKFSLKRSTSAQLRSNLYFKSEFSFNFNSAERSFLQ